MSHLSVEAALARLLEDTAPTAPMQVPLREAAYRVLAAPLHALRTQPPFDASAMDGYAVRAADVARLPASLKVIGQAPAGHRFDGSMRAGECVRIFTGAPLPAGADAVLIQEHARTSGHGHIEAEATVAPGQHVRRTGLDFTAGEVLLEPGRLLDPAALALAAAANHPTIPVFGKPRVALVATGDELLPPGSDPGPDQIIASNTYGVGALLQARGAQVLDLGIVPDRRDRIQAAIGSALGDSADVIVTLGGASVGEHDLVRQVLVDMGMRLDFWKIAMRPGRPLMVGRLGATRVLGLPGNPVASLVCAHLFLEPLVARLSGRRHCPDIRRAHLGAPMPRNGQREDYVRAIARHTDGRLVATPFPVQDSSMLKTLAGANALIVRKPHAPALRDGQKCQIRMLRQEFCGPTLHQI